MRYRFIFGLLSRRGVLPRGRHGSGGVFSRDGGNGCRRRTLPRRARRPMLSAVGRRDAYARIEEKLAAAVRAGDGRERRMSLVADALWDELGGGRPLSWVGFYFLGDGEMTLGP